MGRLIDADAFYKRYCEMYEDGVDEGEIDRIAYMISTEPTAYDTEKVIEQIENMHGVDPMYYGSEVRWTVDKAIEIVRKGGAE